MIRKSIKMSAVALVFLITLSMIPEFSLAAVKRPAKVKGVSVRTSKNSYGIKLIIKWNKAKNAKKYQIYVKEGNRKFKKVRTTNKRQTRSRRYNRSVKFGRKYTVKVRAIGKKGKKGYFSKGFIVCTPAKTTNNYHKNESNNQSSPQAEDATSTSRKTNINSLDFSVVYYGNPEKIETYYTGNPLKFSFMIYNNGYRLKEGTDYIVTYNNNTNIGTGSVTITGTGRYTGSITKEIIIKSNTVLRIYCSEYNDPRPFKDYKFTYDLYSSAVSIKNAGVTWSLRGATDSRIDKDGTIHLGQDIKKITVVATASDGTEVTYKYKDSKVYIPQLTHEDLYTYRPDKNGRELLTESKLNNQDIKSKTASIIKNGATDRAKITAICKWFNENIKYSYDINIRSGVQTFKEKMGVCQGQANLFSEMARNAGVPAVPMHANNHAWSAVYLENKWFLVDTTSLNEKSYYKWDGTYECIIPVTENFMGYYVYRITNGVKTKIGSVGKGSYYTKYSDTTVSFY